jgi:hypothetical protein
MSTKWEAWGRLMGDALVDYRTLLEQFLSGAMSAEEFQTTYLDRFKNETRRLEEPLFELLDGLFGDVDAFTTDPSLLAEDPKYYVDEETLRKKVKAAVSQITSYQVTGAK